MAKLKPKTRTAKPGHHTLTLDVDDATYSALTASAVAAGQSRGEWTRRAIRAALIASDVAVLGVSDGAITA